MLLLGGMGEDGWRRGEGRGEGKRRKGRLGGKELSWIGGGMDGGLDAMWLRCEWCTGKGW